MVVGMKKTDVQDRLIFLERLVSNLSAETNYKIVIWVLVEDYVLPKEKL